LALRAVLFGFEATGLADEVGAAAALSPGALTGVGLGSVATLTGAGRAAATGATTAAGAGSATAAGAGAAPREAQNVSNEAAAAEATDEIQTKRLDER
jgi:hypothetical protein